MSSRSHPIVRANPVLVTLAGLCPSLAVTNRVSTALALSTVVIAILIVASLGVSLLRTLVNGRHRLPVTLGIVGSLAAVASVLFEVFAPEMHQSLGVYLPLTAVNCLVLGRVQSYAWEQTPGRAALDGLGVGVGFLLALLAIATTRELLGYGTITLFSLGAFSGVIELPGFSSQPAGIVAMGTGGFLVTGYLVALTRLWRGGAG